MGDMGGDDRLRTGGLRTRPASCPPAGEGGSARPDGYQGRRRRGPAGRGPASAAALAGSLQRARRAAAGRRITLVVAAVGAVLLGTSALARTLPADQPDAEPGPPPASPGQVAADPPSGAARQGTGPSRSSSHTVPTVSPATEPPPAGPQTPAPSAGPTTADPPPTRAPAPVEIALEAEAAELSGFVRLFSVAGASGGDVVGMLGMGEPNHVRFTAIAVPAAGEYELTLDYVSAPDRDGTLVVNAGAPTTVEFPALGNGQDVGSVTVPVELAAGENEIWFGNASGPAPALDRIIVTDLTDR